MAFISGEGGNKGQNLRETGEQKQYWGTGNIRKQIFDFGEQGNMPIYFRGTQEQVPPRASHLVRCCVYAGLSEQSDIHPITYSVQYRGL